ncbi:fungal-specific transcription factor domain-domain-containing protein [Microdochium bolleyi]|uniref:Fungal-specific transcription factor domain-domain-containing protein n=1 Tax=Microdochium bolleyi TaxID=196109 RepID=A0A136J1U1_9PEZI|nr:fungal-specific transcription factor domain-domain-containing protein [Microdochium bolleyi]
MSDVVPMKVIKVASGAQSRIAQACDRCRSKKIRCDGIRPCCTQCANVGFECRTSDKLSRRAFPRGYTESLEERVRQLESEVKELKDMVDEKDEKIDMLSRMHSQRQSSIASTTTSPQVSTDSPADQFQPMKEDTFRVKNSPILLELDGGECRFVGPSSGYFLMEMLKSRLRDSGRQVPEFEPLAYLHPLPPIPRLFSDKCVNIYFQEWAPLFPVLHKSTFLRTYEEFIVDGDTIKDNHKLAQLYLVFSIASLSAGTTELELVASCERQWQLAIDEIIMHNSMATLQCLVLALMNCQLQANHKRMQYYKGIAVAMSHRLGLHQSQKASSFGSLSVETRKRVFWTLYTLDCFSAARSGLPKLLNDDDVHVAYPVDTDDEYITESGFQPTLPGEITKISSALALFKASRVLSKVLVELYPSSASHEISFQQISALDAELLDWKNNLPAHLQLNMTNDKSPTDAASSRSPILALAYYSIRTLIHRQGFASNMAPKAASSGIAVSECVKHTVQTIRLLDERGLSFSFCFNKTDTMVIAFFTLLYLSLDVHPDSKMMKALGRVTNEVLEMLIRHNITGILPLQQAASQLVPLKSTTTRISSQPPSPAAINRNTLPRGATTQLSPKNKSLQHKAPVNEGNSQGEQGRPRRVTMSNDTDILHSIAPATRNSVDLGAFESPVVDGSGYATESRVPKTSRSASARAARPGLDYLSFGQSPAEQLSAAAPSATASALQTQELTPSQQVYVGNEGPTKARQRADVSVSEWEAILGAMDGGQIYHAIYGGGPSLSQGETPSSASNTAVAWSPDGWDLSGFHIAGDMNANVSARQASDDFANTDMFAGITTDDFHMHANNQGAPDNSQNTNMETDTNVTWSYTDPWNATSNTGGQ